MKSRKTYRVIIEFSLAEDSPYIESDPSTTLEALEELFTDNLYDMESLQQVSIVVEET